MFSKVLLWFAAIAYLVYGVMSVYDPQIPATYAGLVFNSTDAAIEIGAMYGGMSLGLAIFFIVGALQPRFTASSLLLLLLAIGGLGLSRTLLFALSSDAVTSYTLGAIGFELVLAGLALVAFLMESKRASAG